MKRILQKRCKQIHLTDDFTHITHANRRSSSSSISYRFRFYIYRIADSSYVKSDDAPPGYTPATRDYLFYKVTCEEEAASWLLPNPKTTTVAEEVPGDSPEMNTGQQFLFSDPDPYLDLDYGSVDPKLESLEQNSSGTDGVVPVENRTVRVPTVNESCFDLDFTGGSKGFTYGYNCISNSVDLYSSVVYPHKKRRSQERCWGAVQKR